ncbi:MAG: outer membrane beta-barrel protein, partial [Bacteroidales bacterium]|nr:outer membrane beta-barrel protein [Bacteroidales bacterium]
MDKRKLIFLVLAFITCISSFSQKTGSIKGKILDENNQQAIPYATVSLLKNNLPISAGTVADNNGNFIINNLIDANYSVVVSFIGYTPDTVGNIIISDVQKTHNVGTIAMSVTNIALDEVEVSAMSNTATTKIDRKTYRAEDFATAKGGTAVDILDKLPSVSVDGEGIVSVRGTSDFLVYINGKPTQTNASDVLNQVPADQIKNIEIITVPGARYDAQGKGGIINVTTQKGSTNGLSVIANGMLGRTPWTNADDVYSRQKLDNNRYNFGLSVIYNKDRLSVSGALNMQSRNNKGKGIIDPYIYQQSENPASGFPGMFYVLDGEGSRPKWYTNMMGSIGLNYQLTENAEVAASYQYSQRTSGRTANYKYDAFFANEPESAALNGTLQEIYNPNDIHRDGWFSNLSVDYKQHVGKRTQWSTSFIYETSFLEQTIDNKEFNYNGERYYYDDTPDFHSFQSDETPLDAYRFVFDIQHKFKNGNAMSMGIQPQWVRLDGEFTYDTIVGNEFWGDPIIENYDNSIDLERDVYAAYIDFNGTKDKFTYILGLRGEFLNQVMNVSSTEYFEYVYGYFKEVGNGRDFNQTDFKQNKFDLFPTLHLKYKLNKLNGISLAASRRINRPPAKNMAPFLYRRHQEIYEMGDPLL